jgi:hypothetical protein
MYTDTNYKTKKAFKEAVANGESVRVFQPNNIFNVTPPFNGTVSVEGPHYPAAHSWYAEVTITNGIVSKVK